MKMASAFKAEGGRGSTGSLTPSAGVIGVMGRERGLRPPSRSQCWRHWRPRLSMPRCTALCFSSVSCCHLASPQSHSGDSLSVVFASSASTHRLLLRTLAWQVSCDMLSWESQQKSQLKGLACTVAPQSCAGSISSCLHSGKLTNIPAPANPHSEPAGSY